ncbi:MAG: hypothetical protein WA997_03955 [Anaerolineales bacterium]
MISIDNPLFVVEIVAIRVYNLLCGLEENQEMTWQITFWLIEMIKNNPARLLGGVGGKLFVFTSGIFLTC